MSRKSPDIAKKEQYEEPALSDIRVYYKAMMIKMLSYCYRPVDQGNSVANTGTELHTYTWFARELALWRCKEKIAFSIIGSRKTEYQYWKGEKERLR